MPKEYINLVYAIFRQTFEDYNTLVSSGVEEVSARYERHISSSPSNPQRRRKPAYSLKEIRSFLKSGWCETLLSMIEKDQDEQVKSMISQVLHSNEVVDLPTAIEGVCYG